MQERQAIHLIRQAQPDSINPTNMRLRFFTLAISGILSITGAVAKAQPVPTPTPKVGYVRFWDMLPAANGSFEVRKISAPASEGSLLNGSAYQYSNYVELPMARYRLGVFKKGQDAPLKMFDVDLKQDTFFTILLSPKSIDMFDDTIDPKSTSGVLTVRNLFPGINVSVLSGSKSIVSALQSGQSYQATGFPLARTTLTVQANLANGKPGRSDLDIDFKQCSRATLLVIPDSTDDFARALRSMEKICNSILDLGRSLAA